MSTKLIFKELFNTNYRVSDISISYIEEELMQLGVAVLGYTDCDLVLYMDLEYHDNQAEIRINRLNKEFQLTNKFKDDKLITRSWSKIKDYFRTTV